MVHETGKSMARRLHDSRFATRYFKGEGIDIGSGDDSLSKYVSYFPAIRSIRSWDIQDGDAVHMEGLERESFDFVHSSHCLEHLEYPFKALRRWVELCRPGGHIIVVIPDEDLYEQGMWPSQFNPDHKWSFNILKAPGRIHSISVMDLLFRFPYAVEVLKVELLDSGYVYGAPVQDQSLSVAVEPAIEFILRKRG